MNSITLFWKKIKKIHLKHDILIVVFLFIASAILYSTVLFLYFQADEWYFFGKVLAVSECGISCLMKPSGFHFIPFSSVFVYIYYKLFDINPLPYAFFSYILHLINGLLMYIVINKIFGKSPAFFASVFFLVFAQANQSVTWFAAAFAVLPAAFFLLVSIIYYLYSLEGKRMALVGAYTSLIISLFFKEDAIGFFPIFFLYDFFKKRDRVRVAVGAIIMIVYLLIRLLAVQSFHAEQIVTSPFVYTFEQLIRNSVVMPLSLLSSLVFREQDILLLGKIVGNFVLMLFSLPLDVIRNRDIFNENIAYNYLAPLLGFIIALVLKRILRLTNKIVFIGLAAVLMLSLPYIFLPQGLRLESRHYYIFSIALSGVIAYVYLIIQTKSKLMRYVMACLFGVLILHNIIGVRQNLSYSLRVSNSLRSYIESLILARAHITKKIILINTGDPPPLYSGVGYAAMILYSSKNNYKDFFLKDELWNWGSEGYFEHGDTGFGFYLSNNSYLSAVGLPADAQAISLNWNSKTHEAKVQKIATE